MNGGLGGKQLGHWERIGIKGEMVRECGDWERAGSTSVVGEVRQKGSSVNGYGRRDGQVKVWRKRSNGEFHRMWVADREQVSSRDRQEDGGM